MGLGSQITPDLARRAQIILCGIIGGCVGGQSGGEERLAIDHSQACPGTSGKGRRSQPGEKLGLVGRGLLR